MSGRSDSADLSTRVRSARAYVLDLDGTLVLGDKSNKSVQALPGAADLLSLLDKRGIPYLVMTNGTVRTPAGISAELAKAGLNIPAKQILTPATVAASYFIRRGKQKIMVFGGEGVWQPIADASLEVVHSTDRSQDMKDVDDIFIGWHRTIHLEEIEAACNAVWKGAGLYAASMVPFFATLHGRALGSSRMIAAMITTITGRRATALGKPSLHALRDAARLIGCKTSELVVVGDDPELEVKMALNGGALAVGVYTGTADAEDFAALAADRRPHLSFADVAEFRNYLINQQ